MIRSIAAVILGYLAMAVAIGILFALWFRDPGTRATLAFMLGSVAYGFACAVAGGYIAAVVARRAEWQHVMALVGLSLLLGVVSMILAAGKEPLWYQCANMVVLALGIMAGGQFRVSRRRVGHNG